MKRLARVILFGIGVGGCAPPPSPVPLGLGPLAVAEHNAKTAEQQARPPSIPKRAPRKASPDVAATTRAEAPDDDAAVATEGEGASVDASENDEDVASKTAPATGAVDFEGLYAGEDVAISRLPGFPDHEQKDDKAKIRIEKDSAGTLKLTLINSADGSDLCELVARIEGNAALIESPQPCFTSEGGAPVQGELTSGRAVVDGDQLTMDAEGTLSMELADQQIEGEIEYSFKGKRE
jgi:hypothetical protein